MEERIGDLVFTDPERFEQGVLLEYSLDFDTTEEKDFEIKTISADPELRGYFYIEGTEYGGRIDSVKVNTSTREITYTGRNFRGILNSKIVEAGTANYRLANGNITDEINAKITECELEGLFVCEPADIPSEFSADVTGFQYDQNCTLYDGIIALAKSKNMTVLLDYDRKDRIVHITPTLINDYSDYLKYCADNSVNFEIEEKTAAVNHLICVATDEDGTRRTIHLFTDGAGGVQPYCKDQAAMIETDDEETKTELNTLDEDYFLDRRFQVLTGLDEVAEVYECDNSPEERYCLLQKRPEAWGAVYPQYYKKEISEEGAVSYSSVEAEETFSYELLTSGTPPDGWSQLVQETDGSKKYGCTNYYERTGTDWTKDSFSQVSLVQVLDQTEAVTARPADWPYTYNLYAYYSKTDNEWKNYEAVKDDVYTKITAVKDVSTKAQRKRGNPQWKIYDPIKRKWVSWNRSYNSYYKKDSKSSSGYSKVTKTKNKKGKMVVPRPKKGKYFAQSKSAEHAPPWPGKVYILHYKDIPPAYVASKYYKCTFGETAPLWVAGEFYELKYDHYHQMAQSGVKRLRELDASEAQNVTLEGFEVRIGDTVGGVDEETGVGLDQSLPVSNIIVQFVSGIRSSVEYKIGGEE